MVSSTSFWHFLACQLKKEKNQGVFDGPQIRQLIKHDHFIWTMSEFEKNRRSSFKDLVKNILRNKGVQNYTEIFQKLLKDTNPLAATWTLNCIFYTVIFLTFRKAFVKSAMSKINDSTMSWRSWKNNIRVDVI